MADSKKTYEFYLPPPQMGKWESFKLFMYNSERGEVLGRTGSSWAKIGIFYVILYAFLAGFFAAMLAVFYQTLPADRPRWEQAESLIGAHPGLGFRPTPDESTSGSTLIWFKDGDTGTYKRWQKKLDDFFKPYVEQQKDLSRYSDCAGNTTTSDGKPCAVSLRSLGENCTSEKTYGYRQGKPCVAIKLNRIYGWVPETYSSSDIPKDLKVENPGDLPLVYLTCEGENPADRENIGKVTYSPQQGFPASYFPYRDKDTYLSPIVMVQFLDPMPGVLINIECRAWAKNIEYSRNERRGSVHFELLVDKQN